MARKASSVEPKAFSVPILVHLERNTGLEFGLRRDADAFDARLGEERLRQFVVVVLFVDDLLDARLDDRLAAVRTGEGDAVDARVAGGDALVGRLRDGVEFGVGAAQSFLVGARNAVGVLAEAAGVAAVLRLFRRAVLVPMTRGDGGL